MKSPTDKHGIPIKEGDLVCPVGCPEDARRVEDIVSEGSECLLKVEGVDTLVPSHTVEAVNGR